MRTIFGITLLITVLLTAICTGQEWTGQFKTIDGTRVVSNPSRPLQAPETIELVEMWRIEDGGEGRVFGNIKDIIVDDKGTTYILDTQMMEVILYDTNGNFVRTVGREGDGPGEFRYPAGLLITQDRRLGVVQRIPGRIHMFKPNGDPLTSYPLPEPGEDGLYYLRSAAWTPGGVVIHRYQRPMTDDGGLISIEVLVSIDEQGVEIARYSDHRSVRRAPDNKRVEGAYGTVPAAWVVGPDGRIVARTKYNEYELTVYDPDGEVDRVVTRKYESRIRRAAARDALQNYLDEKWEGRNWRGNIGPVEYVIKQCDADIQDFFLRLDGKLWVLTSRGAYDAPHGELGTFDVFDKDGRFIRQVTLLGEGDYWTDDYYVSGDRLYIVTDVEVDIPGWGRAGESDLEQDGDRTIICYQLPR